MGNNRRQGMKLYSLWMTEGEEKKMLKCIDVEQIETDIEIGEIMRDAQERGDFLKDGHKPT